jgi:FlaA1/EpsC-like NDP-sugar epimerase
MTRINVASTLLRLPRSQKRLLALATDGAICAWTAWAALYLRLEQWVPLVGAYWLPVIGAMLLGPPIFIRFGLYRTIFRHTGWPAMVSVARACLLYGAVYSLIFTFISVPGVPRTVGIIQPVLLFLALGAVRALAHYLLGGNYRRLLKDDAARRVIIYGAGASGRQLADALRVSSGIKVFGFIDEDASLHGALIHGLPIWNPERLLDLIGRYEINEVLLAIPSASRRRRRQIVQQLLPAGIQVRTLPGLADIAHGHVEINDVRPVDIEDLLGRDPVVPDETLLHRKVRGKVVMVTGGGGSIGSELCRQIVEIGPKTLLIVDSGEFALYAIHRELGRHAGGVEVVPLLGSVQDQERMRTIIGDWRPDTIYHAAAYKHVPLVEANPLEGLKNNVFGTLELARIAAAFGVADMVLISTDKAVRPTNVMGATKRLAEMVLQGYAQTETRTRFSMVRFGNVLGSSGSVVPLFRDQIAGGGPITITHSEVTRYFMTIPEAAQLVIQASAMASGGEVFVLDMGDPVRIYDLAVTMIELSGLKLRDSTHPEGDIEIKVIGLRPGEKLYEELLIGENPIPTMHERIMQAREGFLPLPRLLPLLDRIGETIGAHDVAAALAMLRLLVPEYAEQLAADAEAAERALAPAPADAAPPSGGEAAWDGPKAIRTA